MKEAKEKPVGRRTRKKETLQQKVVDVAMKLFAKQGFEQVTMETIAAEVDIAKATLYRYFPVKEAILAGYWRYRMLEKDEFVEQLLVRHKTTRKRLEVYLESTLNDALQHGSLFSAYVRFRSQNMNEEELQEHMRSGQHRHYELLLGAGVKAGELRQDVPLKLLTVQIAMTFMLLFYSAHKGEGRIDLKKAIAGFVELYLNGAAHAR
jgi:AcrR family transcriptional regulator